MAARILIPETREPTIWNRYGAMGARVGLMGILAVVAADAVFGGGIVSSIFAGGWAAAVATGVVGMVLGTTTYAGCVKGKSQIELNRLTGRPIDPPTLNNSGLYSGLLNGALIGLAAVAVAGIMTGGIAVAGTWGLAAMAFTAGAAAVGTAFSGYYQADRQRDQMAREYDFVATQMQIEAQMKAKSKGLGLADMFSGPDKGKSEAPAQEANDNKVTMADVAALSARLQQDKKPATQRVMESHEAAAEQAR